MAGMGAMAGLAPLDPPVFLLQEISKFQRRFVITFRLLGDDEPPTGASLLDHTGDFRPPDHLCSPKISLEYGLRNSMGPGVVKISEGARHTLASV